MALKMVNLLLIPDRTSYFEFVAQRSPLSHPIIQVDISDNLKNVFKDLPLYSHIIVDGFVFQKIPDTDLWTGELPLNQVPFFVYCGPTAVTFNNFVKPYYDYPVNSTVWADTLVSRAQAIGMTMRPKSEWSTIEKRFLPLTTGLVAGSIIGSPTKVKSKVIGGASMAMLNMIGNMRNKANIPDDFFELIYVGGSMQLYKTKLQQHISDKLEQLLIDSKDYLMSS